MERVVLVWLILLLKPESRAADYRAFHNKRGKQKQKQITRKEKLQENCPS